jgi:hypothetical protein
MAAPLILPQPYTVVDAMRAAMKNPAIAKKVRKDPKFAAKLRFQIESQMRSLAVSPTSNSAAEMYRRAPINSFLGAMPTAAGSTSVADLVRAQREGFLMADGVQVAGDYTTELRAEKGGIAAPRMPSVGFPAAQSYKYPSRKMITGAALAATPEARDFTGTRRPLPTAGFNPGAFVMSRPDSLNNTLIVNEPVRMPSVRDLYPRGSTYAEMSSASPSDERRRNLSTLLGLPEMPSVRPAPQSGLRARARRLRRALMGFAQPGAKGAFAKNYAYTLKNDPWFILREGVDKLAAEPDETGARSLAWLTGLVAWADPLVVPVPNPGERPAIPARGDTAAISNFTAWEDKNRAYLKFKAAEETYKAAGCGFNIFGSKDPGLCTLEGLKAAARGIIVNTILADRIDLGAIKLPDGQNLNDWINANIANLVPPEYRALVEGVRLMPLDMTESPIRRYMLEQAYEEIWEKPLKDEWYEAISNELRNAKSGSLATAVSLLKNSKYSPKGKAPVVKLKPDALPVSSAQSAQITAGRRPSDRPSSRREEAPAAGEMNTMLLAAGGVAAVALIGLGLYLRKQ